MLCESLETVSFAPLEQRKETQNMGHVLLVGVPDGDMNQTLVIPGCGVAHAQAALEKANIEVCLGGRNEGV